jgi:hypothetical protein
VVSFTLQSLYSQRKIGGSMGLRAGLDDVEKKSFSYWDSNTSP